MENRIACMLKCKTIDEFNDNVDNAIHKNLMRSS